MKLRNAEKPIALFTHGLPKLLRSGPGKFALSDHLAVGHGSASCLVSEVHNFKLFPWPKDQQVMFIADKTCRTRDLKNWKLHNKVFKSTVYIRKRLDPTTSWNGFDHLTGPTVASFCCGCNCSKPCRISPAWRRGIFQDLHFSFPWDKWLKTTSNNDGKSAIDSLGYRRNC